MQSCPVQLDYPENKTIHELFEDLVQPTPMR